jgi:rhamnose utilization protein RhaD (predicted bifunctional aldolase and dehydrogenase)
MDILSAITGLSHEFGTPGYVKGGGGNTSAKTADTLWVKPSGTTLAGLSPGSFVAMDRRKLAELYRLAVPAGSQAREALVKSAMDAAVKPGQTAHPSVESPLHDALPGTFVVHTHPALVNGMACAKRGRETCLRLFPDALWVPYADPGFTLCQAVREHVRDYTGRRGRAPALLVLENHGVFVTADAAEEIRSVYRDVMERLGREYGRAGVPTALEVAKTAAPDAVESARQALRDLLGKDAAGIAYGGIFPVPPKPVSPDHIVYAKSFPYEGALTREGLDAFRQRRGYTPMVFATPAGVFAAATSQKKADLALELAMDGALVRQLAEAFGGVQYMTDAAREFIEHWELEVYRQKQVS